LAFDGIAGAGGYGGNAAAGCREGTASHATYPANDAANGRREQVKGEQRHQAPAQQAVQQAIGAARGASQAASHHAAHIQDH
nr:hypothetical protein [Tanacetum cinerariifolium]